MNMSWGHSEEREKKYTLKLTIEELIRLEEAVKTSLKAAEDMYMFFWKANFCERTRLGIRSTADGRIHERHWSIQKYFKKNRGGGVNMSIKLAQILYRLGFAVTMDGDKHKIVIKRDK